MSTQRGSYWVGSQDSMVVAIRTCGSAAEPAWCFGDGADSLRLARGDFRPLAASVRGIRVVWRHDSVHSTYTDLEGTRRFDTRAHTGALPNTTALDVLIANTAPPDGPGAVIALQPIEANPDLVGDRIKGEPGEIMRLLQSDTAVVEVAGRIVTPYHGVRLVVHYPDRVVRLWVMDSTHYIVRREAQFRNHLAGTWVDSLIGVE
jgi:hypothetical protein